jgi:hypothetical protein
VVAQLAWALRGYLSEVVTAEASGQRLGSESGALAHRTRAGDEETLNQPAGALALLRSHRSSAATAFVVIDRKSDGSVVPVRKRYFLADRLAPEHDASLAIGQGSVRHIAANPELAGCVH